LRLRNTTWWRSRYNNHQLILVNGRLTSLSADVQHGTANGLCNGFTRSRANIQRSPQMKYTLIALAALTLFTGAASAQGSDKQWPCINLKANWMKAPPTQCPQIYIDDRVNFQAPVEIPAPPPPQVDEEDIPK
jgi:hypothetical protein